LLIYKVYETHKSFNLSLIVSIYVHSIIEKVFRDYFLRSS